MQFFIHFLPGLSLQASNEAESSTEEEEEEEEEEDHWRFFLPLPPPPLPPSSLPPPMRSNRGSRFASVGRMEDRSDVG